MILRMINEASLTKDDKEKFIPFVNQRNHKGQIIKGKRKDKSYFKSIQVFQNLKKTTKQYFFDKKYQIMKQKLQRCKISIQPKDPNYDLQIKQCFRALEKSSSLMCNNINETQLNDSSTFFVDLNEKLTENIRTLKRQIAGNNIQTKKERSFYSSHGPIYRGKSNRLKTSNYSDEKEQTEQRKHPWKSDQEDMTHKIVQNDTKAKNPIYKKLAPSINRQIFKQISNRSQVMADFTNYGLKYKHMVPSQKKDPWKKWYVDTKVQLFPGQEVKLKKIQKSIYD